MTIETKFDVNQTVYMVFSAKHLQSGIITKIQPIVSKYETQIKYELNNADSVEEDALHATPEEAIAAQVGIFNGHIDKLNTQLLAL